MSIRKRVKAIFAKPERKLTVLKPEFQQLRQALQQASESREPLTEIVHFFDTVSRWHDRGIDDLIAAFEEVNYGQYDEVLKKLRTLKKHFEDAGRCEYGWNRTKRGETVTADRVFLGNIYCLFTHPVSFWSREENKKKDIPYVDHRGPTSFARYTSAYDVVSQQARQFMASHASQMLAILNNLEAVAA